MQLPVCTVPFPLKLFKLSRAQSHATFLSTYLKIPSNSLTIMLPATHAPPAFHSSFSYLSYSLTMEMTRASSTHPGDTFPKLSRGAVLYIYSLLFDKDICDCQNISVKLPCIYVCLSSGDLFIFLVRVSSFFSYFCIIRTSVLSFPHGLYC